MKTKLILGSIIILSVVGLFGFLREPVSESELGAMSLKADKSDIIDSKTIDGVTQYNWDSKVPVSDVVEQRIKDYGTDRGFTIVKEDITKRTSNSKTFTTDKLNEEGNPVFVGEFISGEKQYHKNINGDWTHLESATTTEANFLELTKLNTVEKIVNSIKKVAIAADFYPDASGVDGIVWRGDVDETWPTIRDGVGNSADPNGADYYAIFLSAQSTNQYSRYAKGIYIFNTSSIGAGQGIDGGSFSIYGRTTNMDGLGGNGAVGVTTAVTVGDTSLANGDYETTISSERLSDSDIDVGSWTSAAYNVYILNSDGKDNINMTGVSKFASRLGFDIDKTSTGLTWVSGEGIMARSWMSEAGGTDNDPKLTLTWSAVAVEAPPSQESDLLFFE